jgi:spermidine/putrescine transport system substrate-binding protein
MTDEPRSSLPGLDAALARGLTSRRLSRRNMIKLGGISVGTLSFASILAACSSSSGGTSGGTQAGGSVNFEPSTASNHVNFSNWPLYIDKAHGTYPSLDKFTNETGITVTYNDEINDNASFFGEILPQLRAGQDTGRDIIVITNGEYLAALIQNGWATELDPAFRPNFDKNAASWAKSPYYDEGNKHTMAWQSGITGIGYNTTLVSKAPTKLDDLMSTDFFPPSSVGVLKEDAPNLVMINLGIDPRTSGQDEWNEAADWLTKLRDSATFYNAYDQGYVDDLNAKNLSGTMAWSGDVLYYKIWGGKPYEFIKPENGALLWIDNMLIPANSKNPAGALQLMDFYYSPPNAQMLTEYILYMSPVPAVQQLIAKHAQQETGTFAEQLDQTAKNPMLWPDQALLNEVSLGRNLTTDEESKAWHDTFDPIWQQ